MPTRLADGLGPESDPDDGSPPPFAPSPDFSEGWFPRVDSQEGEPSLGCYKQNLAQRHWRVNWRVRKALLISRIQKANRFQS
jgi:hypothetical protein